MDKLKEELKQFVGYDDTLGYYYREDETPLHETNMEKEFKYVLETQFGKFIKSDWKLAKIAPNLGFGSCICSHEIYDCHYIEHTPTGMVFQVGCECVHKINPGLYKEMKAVKCEICHLVKCRKQRSEHIRICDGCRETVCAKCLKNPREESLYCYKCLYTGQCLICKKTGIKFFYAQCWHCLQKSRKLK
jgi:hypothetical protein